MPSAYLRKNPGVFAEHINSLNIADVAKWCNGELCGTGAGQSGQDPYILIHHRSHRRGVADIGDWVIQTPDGKFEVWPANDFYKEFRMV